MHKKHSLIFIKSFLISFVLVLTTFYLGFWQIKRLSWKNNLIEKFDELKTMIPINIENTDLNEFVKIKAFGTINRSKKIFFPAKTNNGISGMRIASEFTLENGKIFLLDEGWFDNSRYKYFKNNNEIFDETIEGYIRFPRDPKFFTPKNDIIKNQWYTYDLKSVSKFFGTSLNDSIFIKKTNSNKENFLIASSLKHQFSNNHWQYAVTWFCMSFSFFILFLVYSIKNRR